MVTDFQSLIESGCRPLRDPVRSLSRLLGISSVVTGLVLLVMCVAMILESKDGPSIGEALVITLFIGVGTMAQPYGLSLLLREPARAMVVIRTFRSDAASGRLQQVLRAGVGRSLRVCGIRAPAERVGAVLRVLWWGWSALKYIGSSQHQLEAEDHDWTWRLLAWMPRAACGVIDMRDMSPHVAAEARLCVRALTPPRCLLVVDASRTPQEWGAMAAEQIGFGAEGCRQLVYGDAIEERDMVAVVRGFVAQLPAEKAVPGPDVVTAVVGSVPPQDLRTPFFQRDLGQVILGSLAGAAILLVLSFLVGLLVQVLGMSAGPWSGLVLALPFLCVFFLAVARSWRAWSMFGKHRPARTLDPRVRLVASVVLVLFGIAFQLLVPPALQRARMVAQMMLLNTQARQLVTAATLYSESHAEHLPATLDELVTSGALTREEFDRCMTHPVTHERPCFVYEPPRGRLQTFDGSQVLLREVRGGRVSPTGLKAFADCHVEMGTY